MQNMCYFQRNNFETTYSLRFLRLAVIDLCNPAAWRCRWNCGAPIVVPTQWIRRPEWSDTWNCLWTSRRRGCGTAGRPPTSRTRAGCDATLRPPAGTNPSCGSASCTRTWRRSGRLERRPSVPVCPRLRRTATLARWRNHRLGPGTHLRFPYIQSICKQLTQHYIRVSHLLEIIFLVHTKHLIL